MTTPDHDPSIDHEPHRQERPPRPDPSEIAAARHLDRSRRAEQQSFYATGQSIWDEPDILPGRNDEIIEQDWSCSHCGYNLRGLKPGHPCPECGHVELYRPAPKGAEGYRSWLQSRLAAMHPSTGWFLAFGAILVGGPFAVLGAMFDGWTRGPVSGAELIQVTIFGPAVEEALKIAMVWLVIEIRPYYFQRIEQLYVAALGTALIFAAIENLLYLNIYIPNPSDELILFRWTVCVALHVGCTAVALRSLTRIWMTTVSEWRPPRFRDGVTSLVPAIAIHGLYNGVAAFLAVARF